MQDKGNRLTLTLSTSTSSLPAPQAAKPRGAVAQVAKPPQRKRRKATAFRRERNSDVELPHSGPIEMLGLLMALCDYRPTLSSTNVRGRRLATGDYGTDVAAHAPEDRL